MMKETFYALVPGASEIWETKVRTSRNTEQAAARKVIPGVLHKDPLCWMHSNDFRSIIVEHLPSAVTAKLRKNGKPPEQELKCLSNFVKEGWLRGRTGEMEPLPGWRGKQKKVNW